MIDKYIQEYCDILNEKYDAANKVMNKIGYEFIPVKGRKYIKIVQRRVGETKLMGSAHAFIDSETGDIYKPASWSAPAKGVRANVFNTEWLRDNATCSGGYLYY